MKKYYHVCSQGLEKNIIFSNNREFISGTNDIAICLQKIDVVILCYCLMSNHFHFVLYGDKQDCCAFALEYKRRCGIRLRLCKMEVNALHGLEIGIHEIDNDEYLENVIAYVLRNPLAAKINIMPYHYQWSSANVYFKGDLKPVGVPVNSISERKRHRILKTKQVLPDTYVLDENGMIVPECFVNAEIVEGIFRHPSRLLFALARKLESDVELKFGIADRISYTDAELKSLVNELILIEFGVNGIAFLTNQQKIKLCALMKRNYNASIKQISRIVRIDTDIVSQLV